ncbi:hypothetical protein BH11PSE12_BH11PSE12_22240 [soil metagenome]
MSTARLPPIFPIEAADPSVQSSFFNELELPKVQKFIKDRECPDHTFPPSCDVNLFFGLFFDGTNNNLERDEAEHAHSNVARLYGAFPGLRDKHGSEPWPDFSNKYHKSFFRTYVPGLGTKFKEVGDTGEGFSTITSDRAKGLAFAYKAENRILWAMVQTINNVYRYYLGVPLVDDKEFLDSLNKLSLPGYLEESAQLREAFSSLLQRLHKALVTYLPVGPGKTKDKGVVKAIFVSLFGFSRGAAEARAFVNWFIWLCKLDASLTCREGLSIGSIPVTIDFMGIFDTVASVGIAATAKIGDGHQAWADAEKSLRFPLDSGPKECLHIVSAHEIRRSFPLDSLLSFGTMPPGCSEIVFP